MIYRECKSGLKVFGQCVMWHNELWITSAHASALQWSHNVLNHQPHDCLLNIYSDADQRKYQCSASLVFMRGIHRGPVNSWYKRPVTRKMFPFRQWRLRNSGVEVSHPANRNNAANFTKNSPPVWPLWSHLVICLANAIFCWYSCE